VTLSLARLLGEFDGAGLADDVDLMTPGYLRVASTLVADVGGPILMAWRSSTRSGCTMMRFRGRRDGVALGDAREGVGEVFELGHALGVVFQGIAAGAGPSGGEGVAHRTIRASGVVASVSSWWALMAWTMASSMPLLLGELGADVVMTTLDFVGDSFADVVEQGGGFGDADVGADVSGDHSGQVGHFDGVL